MRLTNRRRNSRQNDNQSSSFHKTPSVPTSESSAGSSDLRILPPIKSLSRSYPNLSLAQSNNSKSNSFKKRIRSDSPMETHITLVGREGESEQPKDVSLSTAAAKIIPAVFNLVPLEDSADLNHTPIRPSFTQAGGHQGTFTYSGSYLEKKVSQQEIQFYEDAKKGKWPAHFLPAYYGKTDDGTAIKIENLTHGFKRPCIMDLKMGVSTVKNSSTGLLKWLKMTALDIVTHSKTAGCRLEGLSMYRTLEKRRVKATKGQTHSLSASVHITLQDVLTFFLTDERGVRSDIALRFQEAVERILEQFENNSQYRFIGSSILLIYDNDNNEPHMHWSRALRNLHKIKPGFHISDDQISGLTRRTKVDVRMIDFAHTEEMPIGMDKDEGYITGLHTIINALKNIRIHRKKPIFSFASVAVDLMEDQRANSRTNSITSLDDSTSPFTFDTVLSELTALSAREENNAQPTSSNDGDIDKKESRNT